MKHAIDSSSALKADVQIDERVACSNFQGGGLDVRKRLCGYSTLINEDGQTKLHLLCQNNSCSKEEVQGLIEAFPAALQRRDVYGRSPLFYALKRVCSVDVVKVLFDGFPDAILFQDFCGDKPLYLLYHSSKDYRILEHVLDRMPSLALHKEHSFSGQTLIARICAPWTSNEIASSRTDIATNPMQKNRWMKLVLTMRAAYVFTKESKQKYDIPELHLALKIGCPPSLLSQFLEIHPEQASIPMEGSECLPLHYYVEKSKAVFESKFVVKRLISAFPAAVHQLCNGRLPLHLALEAGVKWDEGVSELVYAAPEYLDHKDVSTGLIPFLVASSNDECELSTLYSLLRENPAVLGDFVMY